MQQTIITALGFIGLLMLILLGGELSTNLDFSLRRFHSAQEPYQDQDQDQDQDSAAARRRASRVFDPRCGRP